MPHHEWRRHRWGWRRLRDHVFEEGGFEEVIYIPIRGSSGIHVENAIEVYGYELELLKMIHLDNLTVEEAASKISVSKTTAWRIIESAREKITKALHERRPLKIINISLSDIERLSESSG